MGAPHAGSGHDPILGSQIGNYTVQQRLGEGGMGTVYLAEHRSIGKRVALKLLHAEYATNEEVVGRFFNEARAVNDIGHPNIVDVNDFGTLDGRVYFIMEYLAGDTLAEVLRRDAPLSPERTITIGLQIADALAASHRKSIIHRDLKPDNIIILQRGREQDFVKLLDFGIAKLLGNDRPSSTRTRAGLVMGTPAYMSPEQCEGSSNVDNRADVYALGILLYQMLTNQVPFTGDGYGDILIKHLTVPPTPLSRLRPGIPPHLEAVVMKALAKKPDDRYPNMDELMHALADPVGYVNARGGVQGFAGHRIVATNTPFRMAPMTPLPALSGATPLPQWPTTLSGAAGEVGSRPGGGVGKVVVAAMVTAGIAAAGFLCVQKRDADVLARHGEQGDASRMPTLGGAAAEQSPPPMVDDRAPVANPAAKDPMETEPVPPPPSNPPAAPAPVMVSLTLASTPEGALVYFNGERKPRGRTPLSVQVVKSERPLQVEFELSGYADVTRRVELGEDDRVTVTLKKKDSSSSSVRPGGGRVDEGTLDPFSDERKRKR